MRAEIAAQERIAGQQQAQQAAILYRRLPRASAFRRILENAEQQPQRQSQVQSEADYLPLLSLSKRLVCMQSQVQTVRQSQQLNSTKISI
jgi:hypothetical protein